MAIFQSPILSTYLSPLNPVNPPKVAKFNSSPFLILFVPSVNVFAGLEFKYPVTFILVFFLHLTFAAKKW